MKIDDEGLKSLYQAFLKSRTPSSRTDCPSFEDILDLIDEEPERRRREDLIVHISQCALCAEEFDFLRAIRKQESLLVRGIERLSADTSAIPKPKIGSFAMRLIWRYATVLVGICLAFGLLKLARDHVPGTRPSGIGQRGAEAASIKLIKPKRMAAPPNLLTFRWEASFDVDVFQLEIFDEALFPVVSVPDLKVREYRLPEFFARQIPRRGSWSWMVTALTRNGVRISSPLQRFSRDD